jgi:inosine-uridine nucleoside N-ribohydrolase
VFPRSDRITTRRKAVTQLLASPALMSLAGNGRAARPLQTYPTAADTFGLLSAGRKIPVIYDTDIGGDIDDTWALAMLLGCPELDVKLVVADAGNTVYRGRLLARLLDNAGRRDIPVALGLGPDDRRGFQSNWVGDYQLSDYPGQVERDGVAAMIRTIRQSADPVSIISVGAVPNVAEMLRLAPDVVQNSRFVGMYGSIRRGYGNSTTPVAEANVKSNPGALQSVFAAPWDITITPLDTCGIVSLQGAKYQKIVQCRKRLTQAVLENYRIWLPEPPWLTHRPDPTQQSTTLFDTVAVYLAFSQDLLKMEDLPVRVTDDGMTVIDEQARTVHCAMGWTDLAAFEDLLVDRLT